ncbi:MAG: flagellin, partial [Anaerotruncus sp.]|nr:flagellin [Anaerotruncus sp.]
SKALEKLSSGYRINRAGDDASGLAISEKMKSQIKGLDTASLNAQDGISLVQTAEGALTEVHNMLNRMTELATRSANGINADLNRESLQKEVDKLQEEIDRISKSTNFNSINLLDGSLAGGAVSNNAQTLIGTNVSTLTAAESAGKTVKKDISGANMVAATDYFTVDGNKFEIDWTKGDAKKLFDTIHVTQATTTDDGFDDIADKMTELFNNELKAQGINAEVVVEHTSGGIFKLKSTSEGADSEIGWTGSNAATADAAKTTGTLFFSDTAGIGAVVEAGKKFNSTLTANDDFMMTINGTTVEVAGFAAARGDLMSVVAGDLQTNIQTAVTAWNTATGATGTKEELTAADFTVEVSKEGGFIVKYSGDKENVKFSFSEKTENGVTGVAAGMLGIGRGTSNGAGGNALTLQIGDTADSFNQIAVSIDDMSSKGIGVNGVDISTLTGAQDAIDVIRSAIDIVSEQRAALGATQNRLEYTINNLDTASENLQSANSRIRDTDMAKMMMEYTKMNVLTQSAQAMLAQANQQPQSVLQLLQ